MLGQDYPHFLDIIHQKVRLQLASITPAPLPPPTSRSTEVLLVPPIPPPSVFSTALAFLQWPALPMCPFLWGSSHLLLSVGGAYFLRGITSSGGFRATGLIGYYQLLPPTLLPLVSSGTTCPMLVPPQGLPS